MVARGDGRELLDAVIEGVGNIDDAVDIDRHAQWLIELAITAATFASADGVQEGAVTIENLDAVVEPIGHIDIAITIDGESLGDVELAWTAHQVAPRTVTNPSSTLNFWMRWFPVSAT